MNGSMSGSMSARAIEMENVKSCREFRIVNGAFTKNTYAWLMFDRLSLSAKALSVLASMVLALLVFSPSAALAQTASVDWANAGVASQGALPSPTTVTASDGTTATVDFTTQTSGAGAFDPVFAPTFVSFFNGTIGGSPTPLFSGFDNSSFDPNDRVIINITLSRAVTNFEFSLSDIDTGNFVDAVEVFYDDDTVGGFQNAAENAAFFTIVNTVARTNNATVNGWTGTAPSGTASTDGSINFDFGAQAVQRIQIVYFSSTGTGDPGNQFMGISDLQFDLPSADLSLDKVLLGSPPSEGGFATWRLTVTNSTASQTTANGIIVRDNLPSNFIFDSADGTGTFNAGTGEWNVGTLAPGQSASIDIAGEITASAGNVITNSAEIIASSAPDPNSTPDNGATGENDFATTSFTVANGSGGVIPNLPCPVGETVFDWDTVNWPGGSLNNTYALAAFGDIEFDIVTDGNFAFRSSFGGAVPALTTAVSGGLNPRQLALAYNMDNDARAERAVTTVTLPRVFTGAQFSVFDIDRTGTFEDRVTVFGELNGVRVNAILTDGISNEVVGPSIIGNAGAGDTTANGTGVFTFLDPIDTIIIEYGNGPGAPNNPSNQSIAIHDFTFCTPADPDLSVSKISSIIADPVNGATNPKAIPGATVEYLITVTNSGLGPAGTDSVVVWDDGPVDAKMCLIARAGGPVIFADPGNNSGLTYSFSSLGSGLDDLEFSNNDGVSFTYTPTDDGSGCDGAITDFRVNPGGALSAGGNFTITVRYEIE